MEFRKLLTILCAVSLASGAAFAADTGNGRRDQGGQRQPSRDPNGSSSNPDLLSSNPDWPPRDPNGSSSDPDLRPSDLGNSSQPPRDLRQSQRGPSRRSWFLRKLDDLTDEDSYFGRHFIAPEAAFKGEEARNVWFRHERAQGSPWYNPGHLEGRVPGSVSAFGRLANAGTAAHALITDKNDLRLWNMIARLFKGRNGYEKLMRKNKTMRLVRALLTLAESGLLEVFMANAVGAQSVPGLAIDGVSSGVNSAYSKLFSSGKGDGSDSDSEDE